MGVAAYNRGSALIRRQLDAESKASEPYRIYQEISEERDYFSDKVVEMGMELSRLHAMLAEAQAQLAQQKAVIAEVCEQRDNALEEAEIAPQHYKFLWEQERMMRRDAIIRCQQLTTVILAGMKSDTFELAKAEAQAYYKYVDWSGIDELTYPKPPIFGYAMPEPCIKCRQFRCDCE